MKNRIKITAVTFATLLLIASLLFWIVPPLVVDLNKFKKEVRDFVKSQSELEIYFDNAKLITTPLFGLGVSLDGVNVKLPDKTELIKIDNLKTKIALPSLFFLTLKVSDCEINSPLVNLDIANNDEFKIINLIEKLINDKEKVLESGHLPKMDSRFDTNWIKIKIPNVKVNNYNLVINDLKTKHSLSLKGQNAVLAYNGKQIKLKTYTELFSDNDKNITADINISSFIPPKPTFDKEDDEKIRTEFPKINPVKLYRDYNLKANLEAKLKIKNGENTPILANGYLNVENITFELDKLKLPASYIKIKTNGTKASVDTNVYVTQNSKINLNGLINFGKKPALDIVLLTDKINFQDIVLLCKSALDNIQIKNDLKLLKGTGYFQADTMIKTNFKKLKSSGNVIVNNGGIINIANNLGIRNWYANISFDNNQMIIKNATADVNNSKIKLLGQIDEKSFTDINLNIKNLELSNLYNAFMPFNISKIYKLQKGTLNLNASINGYLKNPLSVLDLDINNVALFDKKTKMKISDNSLNADIKTDFKTIEGIIKNNDFKITIPQTKSLISVPNLLVTITKNDIFMNDLFININNFSKIEIDACIKNYIKNPIYDIQSDGNLNVADLKQAVGKEVAAFLCGKGTLPLKMTFVGNKKKQTLRLITSADNMNYITPVDINSMAEKETVFKLTTVFKRNRIKIKDTGIYVKPTQAEIEANPDKKLPPQEILSIDGTIEKNNINLIKIRLPKTIKGSICAFKNSVFDTNGRVLVFGKLNAPRIRGHLSIDNLSIPELFTSMEKLNLHFKGHHLTAITQNLLVYGSDMKIRSDISLIPDSVIRINNLVFDSNNLNTDKLMKVADKFMKKLPLNTTAQQTPNNTVIPVELKSGIIDVKKLKTGNITARSIYSNISMADNVFHLHRLRTRVFGGNVYGNVSANVITMALDLELKGHNLDINKTLVDAAGMNDTLNGTAQFNTKLSLKGLTYKEQMETLNGFVDFEIKNGQLGPFGKLENFILAENIRESQFFQTALGGVINSITTVDTTHFDTLNGVIELKNGIALIHTIASKGTTLCLNVIGTLDIPQNIADMKVRSRLASNISDMLGPIAAVNPINLLKKTPGMNIAAAKAFALFTETVTQEEVDAIPMFSSDATDDNATKFQIVLQGDVNKPLTLVKSFKWLALQSDIDNAKLYVDTLPTPENDKITANTSK